MGGRPGEGAPPAEVWVGGMNMAVPAGVQVPANRSACGVLAPPTPRASGLEGLGLHIESASLGSGAGDFNGQAG